MSNCIQIENGLLGFTPEQFDYDGYTALLNRVKDLPDAPDSGKDLDGYIAWWFLNPAEKTSHGYGLAIGSGRSSHTVRDFNCTLTTLAKFVTVPENHHLPYTFKCRDEYDGYRTLIRYEVDLNTGKEVNGRKPTITVH